jgi:hypothetical protein
MAEGRFLNGRCGQFLFAAFGAIGLGDDQTNFVTSGDEPFERGHRELGSAQKNQDHAYSHSPAFCSFLIFRLIRSRLRALR